MDEFRKELEDYFCRFTFGQFVTLILLEVVTLFFVFYLGARYGPDLLGRRGEMAREMTLPKEGPGSVDEIVGKKPIEYTYPEVLTSPGGEKAIRVKPSGMTSEEYERRKREGSAPPEPPKQEPKQEAKPEPQPEPQKEEKRGRYAIQVGSYPSADEAASRVKHWKAKGYDSFLSVGQIPQKGTWYRVRIGGFPSREEAEAFLERFQKKEKSTALVVLSGS